MQQEPKGPNLEKVAKLEQELRKVKAELEASRAELAEASRERLAAKEVELEEAKGAQEAQKAKTQELAAVGDWVLGLAQQAELGSAEDTMNSQRKRLAQVSGELAAEKAKLEEAGATVSVK